MAFIKVGPASPVPAKIRYVTPTRYSELLSPREIASFQQKVFELHRGLYKPANLAMAEYVLRQKQVFAENSQFLETILSLSDTEVIEQDSSKEP